MCLAGGTSQPTSTPAAQGCAAASPDPPAQVQRFPPGLRFTSPQGLARCPSGPVHAPCLPLTSCVRKGMIWAQMALSLLTISA